MSKKIFAIITCLFLSGCAHKAPNNSNSVVFSAITPNLKVSDAGFIHRYEDSYELEIYNSGVNVLDLTIKQNQICNGGVCKSEEAFNKEFFGTKHYAGLFSDILAKKPIYNGKNLVKLSCGFAQDLPDIGVSYEVCNNSVKFNDTKYGVKLNLKELQ